MTAATTPSAMKSDARTWALVAAASVIWGILYESIGSIRAKSVQLS